mgnify:CR=1 FL=1
MPREQAPSRRAPPPRSGTPAISWRELEEQKKELIAQMAEAEAMEVPRMHTTHTHRHTHARDVATPRVQAALEGGAVQESTATAARARLRRRVEAVEAKHKALDPKLGELERSLQAEQAAETAEAAPLRVQVCSPHLLATVGTLTTLARSHTDDPAARAACARAP